MLLKLDPFLGGVPLTISKVKIPEISVPIFEDQPQLHFDVTCDFLLFAPQLGDVIHGVCVCLKGGVGGGGGVSAVCGKGVDR